jgi:hypothetical protein
MRELVDDGGLPQPDRVEYGYTCIRLFWTEARTVIVVDIDDYVESGSVSAAVVDERADETGGRSELA